MWILILWYIVSFVCLKIASVLDRKFNLFKESRNGYANWTETKEGRNRIATIIFLIPFVNLISVIILIVYIGVYIYKNTKFKIF